MNNRYLVQIGLNGLPRITRKISKRIFPFTKNELKEILANWTPGFNWFIA